MRREVVKQVNTRQVNGSCILQDQVERHVEVFTIGNRSDNRFGSGNVGDFNRSWIVAERSVAVVFSVFTVWISSVVRNVSGFNTAGVITSTGGLVEKRA